MSVRELFYNLLTQGSLKPELSQMPESAEVVFSNLPTLETPRLIMRPLTMRDAKDVYDYSKDAEVARFVLWDAHESIAQTRAYLRFILRQYRNGEPASFGIVLKATGQVIGTIGFMWLNTENRAAEVGYSLSRAYWNQGLMSEALDKVLAFSFNFLKLNRVEAQFDIRNPASGKVMLHCGMKPEGTMRQRIYNKGRYVDVEIYAIVADEYKRQKNGG